MFNILPVDDLSVDHAGMSFPEVCGACILSLEGACLN